MRHCAVGLALLSVVAAGTAQAGSYKWSGHPSESAVVRVADLDPEWRTGHVHDRADTYWHMRYRAAYMRWLHNEYVRSGFPVRHPARRTYRRW